MHIYAHIHRQSVTSTQPFIASVVVFNFVVTRSYYVNQIGLKLAETSLPLPPQC